jgi:hypothetical protein
VSSYVNARSVSTSWNKRLIRVVRSDLGERKRTLLQLAAELRQHSPASARRERSQTPRRCQREHRELCPAAHRKYGEAPSPSRAEPSTR